MLEQNTNNIIVFIIIYISKLVIDFLVVIKN